MKKNKVKTIILDEMLRHPEKIHRTSDLSQAAERKLRRPTNIGPALSALIAKGVISRPWLGRYHLTKAAMPSR